MICDLSDLPVDQCACRIHKPSERAEVNAFEVAHRFEARFSGYLACEHYVREGDTIARTVHGDYVCGACSS